MKRNLIFCAWLTCTAAFSFPASANASPFRSIGFDPSAMAGANGDVAYGDSYGVLFSNPAFLTRLDDQVGVFFLLYQPGLEVELKERPPSADVSLMYYNTNVSKHPHITERPLATVELQHQRANSEIDEMMSRGEGMGLKNNLAELARPEDRDQ